MDIIQLDLSDLWRYSVEETSRDIRLDLRD